MQLSFSERLTTIRAERGLSLRQFAKILDVSPTFLSRLEAGEPPSTGIIEKVADCTGVDRQFLEFLASPIPTEWKRLICESEQSPDFIKAQVGKTVKTKDPTDHLIERLFRKMETRLRSKDRKYYRRLIKDLKKPVYEPKIRAWGTYQEIYFRDMVSKSGDAVQKLETLRQKLRNDPQLKDAIHLRQQVCFRLGRCLHNEGAFDRSIEIYTEGREVSQTLHDPEGIANADFLIGSVYHSQGQTQQAIDIWERGSQVEDSPAHLRGRMLSELGNLYRTAGKLEDAVRVLGESAKILRPRSVDDSLRLAETQVRLTDISIAIGDLSEASRWNKRSRAILERILENTPEDRNAEYLVGFAQCNKARISFMRNRPNRARETVEQIIRQYTGHSFLHPDQANFILKRATHLMGDLLPHIGDIDNAQEAYEESLRRSTNESLDGISERLRAWTNLCELAYQEGDIAQVEALIQKAEGSLTEPWRSQPPMYLHLANLSRIKAMLACDRGNSEAGIDLYLQACEHVRQWNPAYLPGLVKPIGEHIQRLRQEQQSENAEKLVEAILSWGREHGLESYLKI